MEIMLLLKASFEVNLKVAITAPVDKKAELIRKTADP